SQIEVEVARASRFVRVVRGVLRDAARHRARRELVVAHQREQRTALPNDRHPVVPTRRRTLVRLELPGPPIGDVAEPFRQRNQRQPRRQVLHGRKRPVAVPALLLPVVPVVPVVPAAPVRLRTPRRERSESDAQRRRGAGLDERAPVNPGTTEGTSRHSRVLLHLSPPSRLWRTATLEAARNARVTTPGRPSAFLPPRNSQFARRGATHDRVAPATSAASGS